MINFINHLWTSDILAQSRLFNIMTNLKMNEIDLKGGITSFNFLLR